VEVPAPCAGQPQAEQGSGRDLVASDSRRVYARRVNRNGAGVRSHPAPGTGPSSPGSGARGRLSAPRSLDRGGRLVATPKMVKTKEPGIYKRGSRTWSCGAIVESNARSSYPRWPRLARPSASARAATVASGRGSASVTTPPSGSRTTMGAHPAGSHSPRSASIAAPLRRTCSLTSGAGSSRTSSPRTWRSGSPGWRIAACRQRGSGRLGRS
jgi:hypothetical protein